MSESSLQKDLKFLWDAEFLGVSDVTEEEDSLNRELNDFFENTIRRKEYGRYVLSLPFKDNIASLGDNEQLLRSRLYLFIRKLKKRPLQLAAVDAEIQTYLDRGYAEEATPRREGQQAHYLPLQAVFKFKNDNSEIIKTRVVKDAGARMRDEPSLNDCLHQGENLLPNVIKILCSFRSGRYAITADIEKAFLQFEIAGSNRPFPRFLWPLGIQRYPAAPVREFWTRVLDFGLICSPWLHIKGVRYHLGKCKRQFPEHAAFIEEVSEDLYIDDVSFQADSLPDAERKIGLLFKIFGLAKFPLRKWATSDAKIAEMVRNMSPLESTEITNDKSDAKFLGVKWVQGKDEIGVSVVKALTALGGEIPTRRSLLKGLATVFDPLGLLAPVTVRAKAMFQRLWRLKVDWDDTLPREINLEYEKFVELLRNNSLTSVPRGITGQFAADRYELHASSDASMEAYGCVIYLRTIHQRTAETRFLMAKARVAPNKCKWSIHRFGYTPDGKNGRSGFEVHQAQGGQKILLV
ncbi:uncharacterized protein LOC100905463 [Galendromus occidentalis]|uniref:Uncharacterized protein LOC100905463 n=1 Tax=Galendromus occidentalis TaxID=34638 RepID=A0AAJ6QNJ4_9ACAR|nr:uncharacterized protein LOC100905463 [Galendromus occidentalis]